MAAASKMRKNPESGSPEPEKLEVVVDKSSPSPASTPSSQSKTPKSGGMKLGSKTKKSEPEPEEIDWDEINAELAPKTEEPKEGEPNGWGRE